MSEGTVFLANLRMGEHSARLRRFGLSTKQGHIHDRLKVKPDPTGAALDRRSGHQVAAEEMVLSPA